MSNATVEQLEVEIDQARSIIAMSSDIDKLFKNKQFQNVVVREYFNNEAVRLVALRGDREFQTEERQASIGRQMDGIGSFNSFLHRLQMAAEQAAASIEAMQELQGNILAGDGD
jgi:hypothetical protein